MQFAFLNTFRLYRRWRGGVWYFARRGSYKFWSRGKPTAGRFFVLQKEDYDVGEIIKYKDKNSNAAH